MKKGGLAGSVLRGVNELVVLLRLRWSTCQECKCPAGGRASGRNGWAGYEGGAGLLHTPHAVPLHTPHLTLIHPIPSHLVAAVLPHHLQPAVGLRVHRPRRPVQQVAALNRLQHPLLGRGVTPRRGARTAGGTAVRGGSLHGGCWGHDGATQGTPC